MCNEQPETEPHSAYVTPPTDESAPTPPPDRSASLSRASAPLSGVAALIHTLTPDLSPTEALQRALTHAARLLPEAEALCIVALAYTPRRTLELVAQVTQPAARPLETGRETLGLDAEIDQRVLDRRQQAQSGAILCAPLLAGDADLLGVLALRLRDRAGSSPSALAVVRDVLAALLSRRRSALIAARGRAALDALDALAQPEELAAWDETAAPTPGPATDWGAAEWALLQRGAAALSSLMRTRPVIAARLEATTAARVLSESETEPLALADDAEALRGLFAGGPRTLALEDVARAAPALAGRLGADDCGVERVLILPVAAGSGPRLGFALALTGERTVADATLPYATALASACGAGVRGLRLQQRAAEAGRARDEFISFAAHELRSPVTSTKGYAQLLARQARRQPLPEPMMQSVRAVEEQSGRIGDMVGELLDASRIQRGALDVVCQPLDAVPLVAKLVERRASRGERIVMDLNPGTSSLVGEWDPQRVEQIVRDLLDNAARFNPEDAQVRVTLERAGHWAWITVRDEGIGVQPEDRDHIFEYLYRAPSAQKRNISGLGLGLYVSRFLAERMGGTLELVATSVTAPSGSMFRLALPLASP